MCLSLMIPLPVRPHTGKKPLTHPSTVAKQPLTSYVCTVYHFQVILTTASFLRGRLLKKNDPVCFHSFQSFGGYS